MLNLNIIITWSNPRTKQHGDKIFVTALQALEWLATEKLIVLRVRHETGEM